MRRIALFVLVMASLAVLPGRPGVDRADAACGVVVVWHDTAYFGYWGPGRSHAARGAPVPGAVEPGCNDTAGANERPTGVAAFRIRGVPAGVALLTSGSVVVATGYLPQAAGSPVAPTGPAVDETSDCRLGASLRLSGVARAKPAGINLEHVRSSRPVHLLNRTTLIDLFVDSNTRIAHLSRNGVPYIGDGQRVRIEAKFCRVPGSTGPKIVARRIVRAGPLAGSVSAEDVLGADWRGRPSGLEPATRGHGAVLVAVLVLAAGGDVAYALLARRRRPPAAGSR